MTPPSRGLRSLKTDSCRCYASRKRSQTTQLALHLNQHRAARTERDAAEDNNTQGRDRAHTQRPRHRSSKLQATGSNQQATEPAILITGDVTINSIHAYEAVEDKAYLPPDLAASPDDVQNPDIQTSAPISQEKHTMCSPPDIQSSSPSASPSASLAAPPTQPSDERDSVCHVRPSPSSTPPPPGRNGSQTTRCATSGQHHPPPPRQTMSVV
ncbi:hypothetical protein AAFF_G00373930 [Aldrovandia affinis]|uniref:Uncharacterized protein n=1 Tax=Aldrovandia affinis TaxID=143900 RepID=A0AAD7R4P8_9TELE|nr:hypothetical protein AAFF_G00373930 [Aldrovandia affinis]